MPGTQQSPLECQYQTCVKKSTSIDEHRKQVVKHVDTFEIRYKTKWYTHVHVTNETHVVSAYFIIYAIMQCWEPIIKFDSSHYQHYK